MTTDTKLDRKTAENEFNRFMQAWDLYVNFDELDEESKVDFAGIRERLIHEFMTGNLVLQDEQLIYKLKTPLESIDEFTFSEPSGDGYLSMDNYKDRHNMRKAFGLLGAMTGHNPAIFKKVKGRDIKIMTNISTLFFTA